MGSQCTIRQDDAVSNCMTTALTREASAPVVSEEFSHCHVPKTVNLAEQFAAKHGKSGPPTTIMIRNIRNRYTQQQVMMELDTLGFAESYDFFLCSNGQANKVHCWVRI